MNNHIIHGFVARSLEISKSNYFHEMYKFRDFMNTLRNFTKFIFASIFAKCKYLTKQFILTESPDHVL